jgi:hypothetical protein
VVVTKDILLETTIVQMVTKVTTVITLATEEDSSVAVSHAVDHVEVRVNYVQHY